MSFSSAKCQKLSEIARRPSSNNRRGLFLQDCHGQGAAYECLAVAFQIIGDRESAREAFLRSVEVFLTRLITHLNDWK